MINVNDKNSVLYKLKQQASVKNLRPRSMDAIQFYIKRIRQLRTPMRKSPGFQKDKALISINSIRSGMLVYYGYYAITEDLPVWDAFPMTLIINRWSDKVNGKDYFDGINLHYLPPMIRYRILIKLVERYNFRNMDNNVNIFNGMNDYYGLRDLLEAEGFGYAYKKYLASGVTTNFYQIPLTYMDVAINLPLADWQKGGSDKSVWSNYVRTALSTRN